MADRKFLSHAGLTEYDGLIKQEIADGDSATLTSSKSYTDEKVAAVVDGTSAVKEAEHASTADNAAHATSADSATKATRDGDDQEITKTYETKADATAKLTEAKSYTDTEVAKKADAGHNHDADYDEKGAASAAQAAAKEYTDGQITALLDGADDDTLNSIKELSDAIKENDNAIDALNGIAAGKADAEHDHVIDDVTGLQTALNAKAAQTSLDAHTGDNTIHITAAERTAWNAAKTHADSDHAPVDAQKNIIESVKVNGKALIVDASKAVDITVPTNNNQLTNGAGYLVASDIANKADKANSLAGYGITNAYTKTEVDSVIDAVSDIADAAKSAAATNSQAIAANTNSIQSNTTSITNLQAAVGEIKDITSAEIQALFK